MEENNTLAPITNTSFDISSLNLAENNPYVIVAKTGTTVTPYPFERLKFEQGRQSRFSILTSDVVIVKRHFHPDLGYILSDGIIDKYFDKSPSVVYLYPVVHYTDCSEKGKPLSDRIQVKMLQCNKDMYNMLCSVLDVKGDITQFDFLGTLLPGNDKFPKTQLVEAGPALWKHNEKAAEYINTYMKQNGDRFLASVGKVYTPEKLEELLGDNAPSIKETVDQDLDDIFKPQ